MIYKGGLKMRGREAADCVYTPLFRPFPPRLEAPTSGALGTLRFALPLSEIWNRLLVIGHSSDGGLHRGNRRTGAADNRGIPDTAPAPPHRAHLAASAARVK